MAKAYTTNTDIVKRLAKIEKQLPNGELKEIFHKLEKLDENQKAHTLTQEKQFSEVFKHVRSLEKRLYNPDDGIIVKVNWLTSWKGSVTKAMWIIFGGLITLTIAVIKSLGGF